MSQSRRASALEVGCSTAFGFAVSWGLALVVLPEIQPTVQGTFWITCIYTVVSILRQYIFRRLFSRFHRSIERILYGYPV